MNVFNIKTLTGIIWAVSDDYFHCGLFSQLIILVLKTSENGKTCQSVFPKAQDSQFSVIREVRNQKSE